MEYNNKVVISEENGLFIDNEQRKVHVRLNINNFSNTLHERMEESNFKELKPGIKIQRIELSRREKEILGLYGHGKETEEIMQILFISKSTVDTHRNNIMKKLNLNSFVKFLEIAVYFTLINSGEIYIKF